MSDLCPVKVSQGSIEDEFQPETVGESNLLLLQQKKYCDVTFTFPNQPDRIEAHQFCLKARSPVFAKIFRTRESGNVKGKEIEITESTPQRFQQFLEFIYADNFIVDAAGALALLHLAQKYKVHPLAKKCVELLLTKIEVVNVFEFARRHGLQDLMDRAGQIMVKSFVSLIETDALANAEEETLVYLLERDDFNIEEVKLFQLILNWGKSHVMDSADERILKDKLKNVISKIRYTNMTPFEFTKLVVPTGLLSAEESLSVYSYFGGDDVTRAALKIQFNTTERIVRRVSTFVDFVADKQLELSSTPPFRDQSLFFKVERQPQLAQFVTKEWTCMQKTAVISRIEFQWPQIRDKYEQSANLDVNISIIEYPCSNNAINGISEIKFRMDLVGCKRGFSDEIDVKPPVELIPGTKYAVMVENMSSSMGTLRKDPRAYYGHHLPTSECMASRDLVLGNGCLDLKEIHLETNFCLHNAPNSHFTLVLIKGMTIELV